MVKITGLLNKFGLPLSKKVQRELDIIVESGLFDSEWYVKQSGSKDNPVLDYYLEGYLKSGRSCNYLFDECWYLATYPDVVQAGTHPLVHYIQFGENENRSPSPLFNVIAYKEQLLDEERPECLLKHYLMGGWKKGLRPIKYFDSAYYLREWPDISKTGQDPYFHYLFTGYKEGRRPSRRYSLDIYCTRYGLGNNSGISPLAHYLYNHHGDESALTSSFQTTVNHDGNRTVQDELKHYRYAGPGYEAPLFDVIPNLHYKARVIAFYLPQFHPIPENDRWWGEGFTEWSNTTRGLPRFAGHYQPHLAGALGYYDLRHEESIAAQVQLARQAGVSGFCFYYYNFNGTRLLERPVETFLEHPEWDIEFCLTWANENWTRRWDGHDDDILIGQDYLDSCDSALVADLARHFRDPRYIRIGGRPLFIIYRPGIVPDAPKRIAAWRQMFIDEQGENPLIFMAQGFGNHKPGAFGLDGAVEFPPHKLAVGLPQQNNGLHVYDPRFGGIYFAYDDLVASSLEVDPPGFPLIRTAVPMWDNEARKPGRGMGFIGATPAKYERWLDNLIGYANKHPVGDGIPLVFVNAWNEWAEGAHLEPDVYWGHAYLNATKRAVTGYSDAKDLSILYVGHDAHRHGAQLLSLNIVKTLVRGFGIRVEVILLEGGALEAAFNDIAPTHVIGEEEGFSLVAEDVQRRTGAHYAICNTTVTGKHCRILSKMGFKTISLIHELENLIREYGLLSHVQAIAEHADHIVFAAPFIEKSFENIAGEVKDKAKIIPQGIYQNLSATPKEAADFRKKHNIPKTAKLVINLGYGDLRKGFDLFIQIAQIMCKSTDEYYFLWLGNVETGLNRCLSRDIESLKGKYIQLPFTNHVAKCIAASDVLCLTSREDPFPSVVMEALALGVPVAGFENAGGFSDLLLDPTNGLLVPYGDIGAMSAGIAKLVNADNPKLKEARKASAIATFNWNNYVFSLAELLCPSLKRVSVVVPNYNCEPYIGQRLASIFRQRYPVYEIIVLDDASTDTSLSGIKKISEAAKREINIHCNKNNSGSAFHQWIKGAKIAQGELLWIAEADDAAEPTFLSQLINKMDDKVVLAYADSQQIDQKGMKLADNYQYYYNTVDGNLFENGFRLSGKEFVRRCLAVKNLILNVSSTVIRRDAFCRVTDKFGDEMLSMKVAGDWYFYVKLLATAGMDMVFVSEPLNVHRRHEGSITSSLAKQQHYDEILSVHDTAKLLVTLSKHDNEMVSAYRKEIAKMFGLEPNK